MTVERKSRRGTLRTRTPRQSREVAAARLERRTLVVLERALEECGMTQAKLAEALEISAGRVSQIFGSEANLTLSTVARVLAAMGYDAVISAVSMADGSRIEPRVRVRQKKVSFDAYHQTYVHRGREHARMVFVPAGESPDAPSVTRPEYVGSGTVVPAEIRWAPLGRAAFTPSSNAMVHS